MPERELRSSPSMKRLYPKAVGGAALPLRRKDELRDEELVLRRVEIDPGRLEKYRRVCSFETSDAVPVTYPHLLAFPLSMELMTAGDFPFPVMGLVHIENRIEQLRPIEVGERLDVRVRAVDLRPHDKGRQFDVVADVEAGGGAVWRGSSTYLHRGGGGSGSKNGDRDEPPESQATLNVPGDVGRRYGAVSGDRNPIHLYPLTARMFGMKRPIAHGMWMKARCLAMLDAGLPAAYAATVRFKLPAYIPGKLSFASDGESFSLHDEENEKPHLTGMISAPGG